jgi:hypothetical protein
MLRDSNKLGGIVGLRTCGNTRAKTEDAGLKPGATSARCSESEDAGLKPGATGARRSEREDGRSLEEYLIPRGVLVPIMMRSWKLDARWMRL